MDEQRPRATTAPTFDGLVVVDLTRNLAGPFCTMVLGDLGADVIKVERPGSGDDTRSWAPPTWNEVSTVFLSANRNKRSICIDLDAPDGTELIRSLAQRADVIVDSFRPGALERRGLSYESLRAANPRLISCSISAFGSRGPLRNLPGYDPVVQAYAGLMDITGSADGPPARIGVGLIDLGAAMWAAIGILTALAEREHSGAGTHVDTSLFETALWWLNYHFIGYLGGGEVPRRRGTETPMIAPYEVFATADADLFVAAPNDAIFRRLLAVLDLRDLVADAGFATNAERVAHRQQLHKIIEEQLVSRPSDHWLEALEAAGIPCSKVRSVAELAGDPQLEALSMLTAVPHPAVPDLQLLDLPVSLGGRRASRLRPPPALGEHTDEILASLGCPAATIERLRRGGVVS